MSSVDVCAVVYPLRVDHAAGEVVAAAAAQSCQPRVVLTTAATLALAGETTGARCFTADERESAFAAGLRAGQSHSCRWLWLLDGCAVPEPGALQALLAASEVAGAPTPLLLASKVVDRHGRLHSDSMPRHEIFEKARSIAAVERQLVQLRAAAHGSVLVAGAAIDRFGPPRSDLPPSLDMHEWSARMLRSWDDTGYLVPASVALRDTLPVAIPWRQSLARARVLGSSAWSPSERLWEAFLLGQSAAQALRRRSGGHGRAGVGAPGLSPSRRPRRMIGIVAGAKRLKRR